MKNLAEIKKRHSDATAGLWVQGEGTPHDYHVHVYAPPKADLPYIAHVYDAKGNVNFIAHAWQDMADLLAELERLQRENAALRAELEKLGPGQNLSAGV